jgi:hypothetical protein
MTPIRCRASGIVIVTAALVSGCFTSPYEPAYRARLGDFRRAAEFAVLAKDPEPFADGRVRLRLPRQLAPQQQDEGAKLRARPPFARQFPGFIDAREATFTAGNSRLPVILTLGIVPTTKQRHAEIEKDILQQVRADEAFPKADWQKGRTVEPVAGGPAIWDVLSLQGQQEFESVTAGNVEYKKWPATCEIWVSADPKQEFCTIIALRAPDDVATNLEMPPADMAALVARSVEILPPPDAPAAP